MALVTRLKTWVTGDILTASDLNNEFNNIINEFNGSITTANLGTLTTISFVNTSATETIRISTTPGGGGALLVHS